MSRKRTAKRFIYTLVPGGFLGLGLFFLPLILPLVFLCQQISKATKQVFMAQSTTLSWMGPSVVEGVELKAFENAKPWVKSKRVSVDLGLWQAIASGTQNLCLDASGAELEIAFDPSGKLLTQFPITGPEGATGNLPMVRVEDAVFRLVQEGHPPLEIRQIAGQLLPDKTGYQIDLTSQDPEWGNPKLKGYLTLMPAFSLTIHLETGTIPVTLDKLHSIPFVPQSVWESVQLTGKTPLVLDLAIGQASVDYRVEVEPTIVEVTIPAIQLQVQDAKGHVLVEKGKVTFDKLEGKAFGGKIKLTKGDFHFGEDVQSLDLNVGVEAFSLKSLPQSWGDSTIWKLVPVDAKISGEAVLGVSWTNSQPLRVGGGGNGKLYATLFGFTKAEWGLRLESLGNRFLVIPNLSRLPNPLPLPKAVK